MGHEEKKAARKCGLRYVSDENPGICRRRNGKGFSYFDSEGRRIAERAELKRIKSLVIPPAWQKVWICPIPHGHLQATGRDSRGRKQYLYHPLWREVRDEDKFQQMLAFGRSLSGIREAINRDIRLHGLKREKVLATVVRLLDSTLVRIGNREYEKENQSFGLTTLKNEHLQVSGSVLHFQFRGKGGKERSVKLTDKRLSKIIKLCQDLPGQDLFQYLDEDGEPRSIDSADVNSYLSKISGQDFTAKDFRTWGATVHAAIALIELGSFESKAEANRKLVQAVKHVAKHLGNKPSTCRKYYIHPEIIEAYLDQSLIPSMHAAIDENAGDQDSSLEPEEKGVLALLEKRSQNMGIQ